MSTEQTFESIAAAGRAIIDAHKKKKGFEDGIRRLLSELYPDNAHFIYELLQNAEDAHATVVEFELCESHLEVRHNGSRPFSLSDIDSITSIGNSTKKDDPTQIGKFGVGFKAVYSYTTRPEIRSGEYSFAIEDLFVNESIDGQAPTGQTIFRFPFDRDEKPANVALEEIAKALTELDEKTLLFLNYVATVTYTLPDETIGIIERQKLDGNVVEIKKADGEDFVASHWLRLVGAMSVKSSDSSTHSVAAAFRLADNELTPKRKEEVRENDKGTPTRCIVPLDHGDVSIYFPAVKEKSGLKFHIHAPFASTVARDSVRDDPDNVKLIKDIGHLIVDALPDLRDRGLIDDSFLTTLPNHEDPVGYPYSYIRDLILDAFNRLEITPVRGNGYAAATSLVSSPSEFRRWLMEADLPHLLDISGFEVEGTPRWIRDRDGRAGKFLGGLDTIQFGWEEMDRALANATDIGDPNDPFIPKWLDWLATKDDTAISSLYQLLGRGWSTVQLTESLQSIPLVRVTRRDKSEHVKGPDTYLPSSRNDNAQRRVPVGIAYFDDDEDNARITNLKAFYRAAGVHRWDERARIEARLKAYLVQGHPIREGDGHKKHLRDVRAFVEYALSNKDSARGLFEKAPFLEAVLPDGSISWVAPDESYLDLPYQATGLSSFYPWTKLYYEDSEQFAYYRKPYPVASSYLEIDRFSDFLELVGSKLGINITRIDVYSNPQFRQEWRAGRRSEYTEEVDWQIEGFNQIMKARDLDLLHTLWRTVVHAKVSKAEALYRANNSAPRYTFDSRLIQQLNSIAWVLDKDGELRYPREMTVDDLAVDWEHPHAGSLVYKLAFGDDARQRSRKTERVRAFLRDEGLDDGGIDVLREAKEAGMSMTDLRSFVRERLGADRFPDSASADPSRRSAVAWEDAANAPQYRTGLRQRSVVDGLSQAAADSKYYLREQYTTEAGQMFCQACQKPLPFKLAGKWYFESVRFINARQQIHTANAIALCPLCAALYKYVRETNNETLLENLQSIEIGEGQGSIEIPLVLDGKLVHIRFTGRHAIDLQAALQAAGKERAGNSLS